MESLDITKIWKSAQNDELLNKRYSIDDIQKYRKQKSHQTSQQIQRSILFDVGYKSIAIAELIYLLISLNYQYPFQIIIGLLLFTAVSLCFIEIYFLKKFKSIRDTDSVLENLKNKLSYLKTTYKKFIFISALSNPLFVLSSFFIYYLFKYNEIKLGTPAEDPVLYLILLAAFAISLIGQLPVYKMQKKELLESIYEMDDADLASIKIQNTKQRRRITLITFTILVLLGVLALLLILIL